MTNKIKDAIYTKRYVYNLHFHLIWCTKYRNKTFTNEKLSNEMKDILQRVADDNEIVIEKNGSNARPCTYAYFISTKKISNRRNQSTKRQKCIPILTNTSRN